MAAQVHAVRRLRLKEAINLEDMTLQPRFCKKIGVMAINFMFYAAAGASAPSALSWP